MTKKSENLYQKYAKKYERAMQIRAQGNVICSWLKKGGHALRV
jgi:hypothetical protein